MSEEQPTLNMFFLGWGIGEARDLQRRWEDAAESWRKYRDKKLWVGADNFDGDIYAEKPSDLVSMTEDEWRHWCCSKNVLNNRSVES
jgi:hypothetical protein